MFYKKRIVLKSDLLDAPGVGHVFSTRKGGVSTLPHTSSMNAAFGKGDDDDVVRENIKLLCEAAGISYGGIVGSAQHHTTFVRCVTADNAGEGIYKDNPSTSDGFATDCPGVSLIVRTADCAPILAVGQKTDGSPVVGAAHSGWKGTVGGIGANLVAALVSLGADPASIRTAIGPCIGACHFEVKEDFIDAVTSVRGEDFASRHIKKRGKSYFADLAAMNVEMLEGAGIPRERIDVCGLCTVCDPVTFHSHRATNGVRGTMGNVIGIIPRNKTF